MNKNIKEGLRWLDQKEGDLKTNPFQKSMKDKEEEAPIN